MSDERRVGDNKKKKKTSVVCGSIVDAFLFRSTRIKLPEEYVKNGFGS